MNRTDLRRRAGIVEDAQTVTFSIESNLQTAGEMLNMFKQQPSGKTLDLLRKALMTAYQATTQLARPN